MKIKELVKTEIELLREENARLREKASRLQKEKDEVYTERNQLVAFLSKVYPSGYVYTPIIGWNPDFCHCAIIDLPTGQASWHFHQTDSQFFSHLTDYPGVWDGHTTEQKYQHIQSFKDQNVRQASSEIQETHP